MNLQPMLHVYRQVQEDVYTNPLVWPDLHAKIKNILDLSYPYMVSLIHSLNPIQGYPIQGP